jgi:hypothetical protein
MRMNKSQREGIARVCDNLASGGFAISIIGYLGFGASVAAAAVVFSLAILSVVAALVVRATKANSDD